jgi:glycosyltransferase involved in cell wall biosynthesis
MSRIDIICSDGGSPMGVTLKTLNGYDPKQIGVGGAELALLTMCELWTNLGHTVRLYNNPRDNESYFTQLPVHAFNPRDPREILVVFRAPDYRCVGANGLKIWWSCDQYTSGDYKAFAPNVDKIVTISPRHADFFKERYGIENTTTIDLAVRTWEYEQPIEKIKHRCIFTSVPDRGLAELLDAWPIILGAVPDASLVITSDYRLWGVSYAGNERYIQKAFGLPNVTFMGAIKRPELVKEQLKAEFLPYPCNYDELFCIAVAEAQVAGAFPITPKIGALTTTNEGWLVGKEGFTNAVIEALLTPPADKEYNQKHAQLRFSPKRILGEWDKLFGL